MAFKFEKLKVWQRAVTLSNQVYLANSFDRSLCSKMRLRFLPLQEGRTLFV